ncbi:hypothetical protein QUB33_11885 [Microcoleus sp. B3-A4]|uniref:hypothetical protein n=1 Tax=Microcoleus sp. B3-A4 TaxID=2818653 RepID=UPI002FCF70B0
MKFCLMTLVAQNSLHRIIQYRDRDRSLSKRKKEEGRSNKTYTASFLVGLKPFLASLKAETPSREWKEIDNLKMPQTLGITRLMPVLSKSISLSAFEAKMASVFV